MFEALIGEVAGRFGLGDKARELLAALLAIVFDESNGGIAGLLAKFRQRGFGDLFGSWIGNAQPRPIDPQQLEHVLGASTVSAIAQRLRSDRDKALGAAAAMLPALIGLLTRNGQLPTSVPSAVGGYLIGFDGIGGFQTRHGRIDEDKPINLMPTLGWLKWALLLAVLLVLGYWALHRAASVPAPLSISTPVPTANARLG